MPTLLPVIVRGLAVEVELPARRLGVLTKWLLVDGYFSPVP